MRTYFLTTERMGFSIWNGEDAQEAAILWGDPEVTRYLVNGGKMTPDQVIERLGKEIECFNSQGIQYWPIFLKDTGQFVGCCGLRPLEGDVQHMEMGVHLLKEHWGNGIATEACTAVIGYAFDRLHAEWILAGHNPQNRASARLLVNLGFRFIEDKYYPPTGLMHPSYRLQKCGRRLR
jgi:ribosomal-protein-alanine N-acetyltransferase